MMLAEPGATARLGSGMSCRHTGHPTGRSRKPSGPGRTSAASGRRWNWACAPWRGCGSRMIWRRRPATGQTVVVVDSSVWIDFFQWRRYASCSVLWRRCRCSLPAIPGRLLRTIDAIIATACLEANLPLVYRDWDFLPYVEHLGVVSIRGKSDIRSQWPAHLGAAAGELHAQPGSSRIRWLSAASLSTGWPQPGRWRPKSTRGLQAWTVGLNAKIRSGGLFLALDQSSAPVF